MIAPLAAFLVAVAHLILPSPAPVTVARPLILVSSSDAEEDIKEAVEEFEELTEKAFKSKLDNLEERLRKARGKLSEANVHLSPPAAGEASSRLSAAEAALAGGNRADLAISSIEVYRILVSALPPSPTAPLDVSLMDYAGFRYRADLEAEPRRWDDMIIALIYAQQRWAAVRARVTDAKLASRYEMSLLDMGKAAAARDPVQAARAVETQLELVDDLERFFRRS